MNETNLILRDDGAQSIAFSGEAEALREQALADSVLIAVVRDAADNETATRALHALQRLRVNVEKARKAVKEPVLEFGRAIDVTAKQWLADVDTEAYRLSGLLADFQSLENARFRAAQQKANEALLEVERQRAVEMEQAKDLDEINSISEKYSEKARVESEPPPPPAKAPGQRISYDWNVTVIDVWTLARAHPGCVKIEPRLSEIKALLNAGAQIAGIKAERILKAGVRLSPEPKAIDV